MLDLVGLAGKEERFPHQLSGGEQQRVSVARAFVNRPLILLADEPTGNLDPATGEGIMRLLDRINQTGTTVLMATHDQRIVNTMRKRVIQLDRGVIVRDQARGRRTTDARPPQLHTPGDARQLPAQHDAHGRGDHHVRRVAADLRADAAHAARLRQPARRSGRAASR